MNEESRVEKLNQELEEATQKYNEVSKYWDEEYPKQMAEINMLSEILYKNQCEKEELINQIKMVNTDLSDSLLEEIPTDRLEIIYRNIVKGKCILDCLDYSKWYCDKLQNIAIITSYSFNNVKNIMKLIEEEDLISIGEYGDINLLNLACKLVKEKRELIGVN